jgi:hypothetical protein
LLNVKLVVHHVTSRIVHVATSTKHFVNKNNTRNSCVLIHFIDYSMITFYSLTGVIVVSFVIANRYCC